MNSINNQNSNLAFQARFQKLPGKIKAQKMLEEFTVPSPWAKGEVLKGHKGDSLVTNLLNGEQYPIQPEVLAQKYEHVAGDIFQTRMDKPVYIEADLPKSGEIVSREGVEKTSHNGMPAMVGIDGAKKPYAIPGDYFLKSYTAVDEAGQKIMESLKKLMPKS